MYERRDTPVAITGSIQGDSRDNNLGELENSPPG
jgi:hypothetical protein